MLCQSFKICPESSLPSLWLVILLNMYMLHNKFHWLLIMQRIKFNVRCLDTRPPMDLHLPTWRNFFIPVSSTSALSQNRSAARENFIVRSATRIITYRQRSFSVAGPTLQKSLPLEIHSSISLLMFCSRLKTYLFRAEFQPKTYHLKSH